MGGDSNRYVAIPHGNQITQWHYIYFGYSRQSRRAYFYAQLKNSNLIKDFTNTNHYLAEKFFFVLKDTTQAFWNGQYGQIAVNIGKGAFKAGTDYTSEDDIFQLNVGT